MTALRPATALSRLPLHLLPSEWQSSGLARTSSPSTTKEGRQKGKRPFWHAQRDAELRTPHCASLSQRPTRLALCSCWACRVKTNSPCAGPRNRPKSGCCGPAEATYKLFSRQWRKKKVTSGSFPLSCGLSWHNATIFLIKLSSWRIYLFVRRPVTSFLVSF